MTASAGPAGTEDRRVETASRRPGVALRRGTWPAWAVGALSATLCAVASWHVSFWKDETDSLSASTRGANALWRLVHHIDAVHAVYYFTLDGWLTLTGQTEFAARFPSALATGIAAAGVFVTAARIAARRTAWTAAIVFAVLPRVTWMGIEARPFAYTAAAGAWMTYMFVRGCQENGRRFWVWYGLVAGLGVAVNVYVALLVVSHGVGLALGSTGRERLRRWLVAAVGAAVIASPVAIEAAGQRGQLGDTSLGLLQTVRSVIVNQWFLGNTPNPSGQPGGSMAVHSWADLWRVSAPALALLCWVLVLVGMTRAWRERQWAATDTPRLMAPAVILPTLVVAGYSLAVSPMYSPRYFCFVAPAVAVLVATGLEALRRRWLQIVALAAIVVLAAPVYVSQRTLYGKGSDWVSAADFVAAHKGPGQGVYFTPRYPPPSTATSVGSTARYVAIAYPSAFRGLRDITLKRTGAQDNSLTGTSELLSDSTNRLAGITAVWVLRRHDYPSADTEADDRALERRGFTSSRRWSGPTDEVIEFVRRS